MMMTAVPSAPSTLPGFRESTGRVFGFSLAQMLWSRRTIFMLLVVGSPVVIALVIRLLPAGGVATIRVNGARVGGNAFGLMIWLLYVRFIVPVLGVFYGTALIADEVEDRTITYLFTRPIPRGAVLMGKYLAYLVCTSLVVLPSMVFVYAALVPVSEVVATAPSFLKDLGILALGLSVYGAVFGLIGATVSRPLLAGLVFAFGWETIALLLPGYVSRLTVAYYVQALVPHAMPVEGEALLQAAVREGPSPVAAISWLLVTLFVCLWFAVRAVERREYVLEQ